VTSIVGISCVDGVVIGTDSSATFAAGKQPTIEQPTDKLDIIQDHVIVAGTGQVGLGQRFCAVVSRMWTGQFPKKTPLEIGKALAKEGINDFAQTDAAKGQYGALVAFAAGNQPYLCEFASADFQPELKNDKIWYVSMGSAQFITDPFLGFLREVFWDGGRPKLQDAIFAVTWVLEQAVALNPGGVSAPIRLAILEQVNGKYQSRRPDDAELAQHRENVVAVKAHLRKFKTEAHQPAAAAALPDIPQPE
jgi:hypothetical protein